MKRRILLCLMFAFGISMLAKAQVNVGDNGTLSGTVFGDYYWIPSNHDAELEGNNGFWFRRIYFTYDHQLSDSFSGRFRLDMSSAGDFTTNAKLEPTVKDAWLKWSADDHSITAGITSTPTWGLVEDVWGYRSVEKSPLDLYDFGSSRDFGLSFKGNLDSADKLTYHFMFANGNSNRTELNKGKKFMLSLGYHLTQNFVIQGYADWDDRPGNTDRYTTQAFAGYQSDTFNLGALYAYQLREIPTAPDLNLDIVSLFANSRVTETVKIFGRIDHLFDQNPTGPGNDYLPISDKAESTFLTTGVDVALEENIHLIPNIESVIYGEDASGNRPKTDIMPRLTLFYKF